jgi:hypothetical protein
VSSVELSIALPLGVVANQLMKIEADLRLLSVKAGIDGREHAGASSQIGARLEKINESLETIRSLIADIERDLQPPSTQTAARRRRDDRDD